MSADRIRVEVAYATPQRQVILELEALPGVTIADAVEQSGICDVFPEIDLAAQKVGIFGKAATLRTVLADGDRVEIYRHLVADPKEARRKRVAEGKSLKNRAARRGTASPEQ